MSKSILIMFSLCISFALSQARWSSVHLPEPFNVSAVTKMLWKSMKDLGSYEQAIIDTLQVHSLNQRLNISEAYKTFYGRDLVSDLKSELPSKFEKNIVTLMNPPRSPDDYAKELHDAIFGSSINKTAIIDVLTKLGAEQRLKIAKAYNTNYQRNLVIDLESKLSRSFKDIIVALMTPLPDFYAKELHDSMHGLGTDEETLIEILFTSSNEVIHAITHSYEKLYGRTLESDVKDDTSGYFKWLLVLSTHGNRNEMQGIDHDQAVADAKDLSTVDETKWASHQSKFKAIFVSRSFEQLRQTFIEYKNFTGHSIEEAIKAKRFSRDFENGLLEMVKCATSKVSFFVERLYNNMRYFRTLTRIIVSRSEIDLEVIKKEFKERYGKTLESKIKEHTYGSYEECLLSLVST